MVKRADLLDHLREIYGRCDRDQPGRNDCYWGKNERGQFNGCLKLGWRGTACPHWHPDDEQCREVMKHYGELE